MAAVVVADESYGEDSLRTQYSILDNTNQLKQEKLYKDDSYTSFNKFIKVMTFVSTIKRVDESSLVTSSPPPPLPLYLVCSEYLFDYFT